jgi:hypothetical protein
MDAAGSTFVVFGIFPNPKCPDQSQVLLIDENAALEVSNIEVIFRSSPLRFVGLVPNGRAIDSTCLLLQQAMPLGRHLFDNCLQTSSSYPLSALDFNVQKSEMKERPKRKAAGERTFTEDPLPAAPSKLELSPVNPNCKTGAAKLGQEVLIGASQGLSTPPCI